MAKKTYPHPHARSIEDRLQAVREALAYATSAMMTFSSLFLPELPENFRRGAEKLIADTEAKLQLASRAMRGEDDEKGEI